MLKCAEHVRTWTAWLLLLGFLCWFAVPAESFAVVHREIATEGDPGDGNESDGIGGGGGGGAVSTPESVVPDTKPTDGEIQVLVIPVFVGGMIELIVVEVSREWWK